MVAGCGMTCIKYIVFAVNFLFFIVGGVTLGLGVYALVDKDNMSELTNIDKDGKLDDINAVGLLQQGAIVLIVAGSGLMVLGFLGCCGAVKEIKCLLALYAGIIVLILIIQIAAAGIAIAFKGRISDAFKEGLIDAVKKNYDGNIISDNGFSRAFDYAQAYFECCGVSNTDDFTNSPWYNTTRASNQKVPVTCCQLSNKDGYLDDNAQPVPVNGNCQTTGFDNNNPFTNEPCFNSISDWVEERAVIIIAIAFGIIALEVLAVVMACCLYRSIES